MINLNEILKDFHSIVVDDGGGSITVDGTVELGATSLAALENITATIQDGGNVISVDDAGGSLTVDGSVSITGDVNVTQGTSPWVVSGTVTVGTLPGVFAEDSVHASGDLGMQILAVRNDTTGSLVSANGDYAPLQVNSSGRLRTNLAADNTIGSAAFSTSVVSVAGVDGGAIVRTFLTDTSGRLDIVATDLDIRNLVFADDKVDVSGSSVSISGTVAVTQSTSPWVVSASDLDIRDLVYSQDSVQIKDAAGDALAINADGSINVQTVEAGYSSWSVVQATVGASEAQLVSSPLTGRLRIEIQNIGSKDVWVRQSTGVSTSNGLKIPKGTSWEAGLDAGASIYAISDGASADLRIAQYAA